MIDNCSLLELKLVYTAAQMRSISKAAKIYSMSQSAASSAIQRVEKALGFALLDHGKNRFQLTAAGHQFIVRLEKLNLFLDEIKSLKKSPKGPWRLALPHSLAVALLPSLLKHFESLKAGYEISLRIGHATTISKWVTSGEVDVAMIIDQDVPLSCIRTPLFTGHFRLYSHETSSKIEKPLLIDSVKQESIELFRSYEKRFRRSLSPGMNGCLPQERPFRGSLEQAISNTQKILAVKRSPQFAEEIFNISSWEVIAALVEAGYGVGFLPDLMELSHRKMKRVSLKLPPIKYEVTLLTHFAPSEFGMKDFVSELHRAMKKIGFPR